MPVCVWGAFSTGKEVWGWGDGEPQGDLNPLGGLNEGALKTILHISHKWAGVQGAPHTRHWEGVSVGATARPPCQSSPLQPFCILATKTSAWHCALEMFLKLFAFLYSNFILLISRLKKEMRNWQRRGRGMLLFLSGRCIQILLNKHKTASPHWKPSWSLFLWPPQTSAYRANPMEHSTPNTRIKPTAS